MIKNDKQLGTPFVNYTDTKSAIESLSGVRVGATAVATDNPTAPFGVYINTGWHWYTTGSVGGASLAFQDEGVPLGTPGTVNFVGSPVSVTVSGTVARVFITGSSGVDHNSLTGLQGGTGSQYYHLAYNEWGGLVTGSLTYLHKHSATDIVTGTMATARLGSGTANNTSFLRGDSTWVKQKLFFPFAQYIATNPISSDTVPYIATVDRTITFIQWSITLYVAGTNNGSNYWTVSLERETDGQVTASVNTSADSGSTYILKTVSSFTYASYGSSDKAIRIHCAPTGAPGGLYAMGTSLEVEI